MLDTQFLSESSSRSRNEHGRDQNKSGGQSSELKRQKSNSQLTSTTELQPPQERSEKNLISNDMALQPSAPRPQKSASFPQPSTAPTDKMQNIAQHVAMSGMVNIANQILSPANTKHDWRLQPEAIKATVRGDRNLQQSLYVMSGKSLSKTALMMDQAVRVVNSIVAARQTPQPAMQKNIKNDLTLAPDHPLVLNNPNHPFNPNNALSLMNIPDNWVNRERANEEAQEEEYAEDQAKDNAEHRRDEKTAEGEVEKVESLAHDAELLYEGGSLATLLLESDAVTTAAGAEVVGAESASSSEVGKLLEHFPQPGGTASNEFVESAKHVSETHSAKHAITAAVTAAATPAPQ
jgi:hypothetical protein